MPINTGDTLPEAKFTVMSPDGPKPMTTDEVFKGKKVVLFAVPGAFTPTCSEKHLPGFVDQVAAITQKGVATVACTAVNDVFVLNAWSKARSAEKVLMLADGSGDFAKKIGLDVDLSGFGLGLRSKRYAMIVDDGVVKYLAVENAPPDHDKATADNLIKAL